MKREITRDQAIAYYLKKKNDQEIETIREFALVENPERNWFVINENYVIRLMTPEPLNCLMRNQNYTARISGSKFTKKDIKLFETSNRIQEIKEEQQ